MNKRKLFTLAMTLCMVAILAIGGTLAYFTDVETADNVFTVGSVEIKLLESKLHRQNDNASDEDIEADAAEYQKYLAEEGKNIVPGKWVKKAPYIKNTGKNSAYVRIKATFPDHFLERNEVMLYTTGMNAGAFVMDKGVKNADYTTTYTFTFTKALEPGEMTYYAPFWQVKIQDDLDNDAFTGVEEYTIKVVAEAIQAETFGGYEEAFAAFDAQ